MTWRGELIRKAAPIFTGNTLVIGTNQTIKHAVQNLQFRPKRFCSVLSAKKQKQKLETDCQKLQRTRWGSHGGTRSEMKTSERKLVQGNWKI